MTIYTHRTNFGDVIRTVDGVIVAPTGDMTTPDYLAWIEWCNAGNEPDIDDVSLPPEEPVV